MKIETFPGKGQRFPLGYKVQVPVGWPDLVKRAAQAEGVSQSEFARRALWFAIVSAVGERSC